MNLDFALYGKLIAVLSGIAGLLGLPRIVPMVTNWWVRQETKGLLSEISNSLDEQKADPEKLGKLQERCDRAVQKLRMRGLLDRERLIRDRAQAITSSLVEYVKERLEHNKEPADLYELQTICHKAIETTEEYQLRDLEDQATEILELLKSKRRFKVRCFCVSCPNIDVDLTASMLLAQNERQDVFQFELGHFEGFDPSNAEKRAKGIRTDKLLQFVKEWETTIADTEREKGEKSILRLVITEECIPGNRYLWGHFPGGKDWKGPYNAYKFWIVSPTSLTKNLRDDKLAVSKALLRIVQRASIISVAGELNHEPTYGCLFDYTRWLSDAQHFVRNAFICEECRSKILHSEGIPAGYRTVFLREIQKWIKDSKTTRVH